jgi:photosystem II stability/assembly factor-like uncharacterized protein
MKSRIGQLSLVATLLLMGAGCFGGSDTSGTDGGPWKTEDGGKTWVQQAALPTSAGVGSINGVNVTAYAIDPSDATMYYIGTDANGMMYSLNNGEDWQRPEEDAARAGKVIDIEVDPTNVCTVYVLKSDRLLKTTDCMRSFSSTYIETRPDESLTAFTLDWYNAKVIWVGTTAGDVIRSSDGGASWATITHTKNDVSGIELSRADSRIVLVGSSGKGLFRTEDGGVTWTEYEDTLKAFKNSDYVYGFAQTTNGSSIVMNTKYGLLVSGDKGLTWTSMSLISNDKDARAWSLAINPSDANDVYYGTSGVLYHSTNGGQSWQTEDFPSGRMPLTMLVHPTTTDRLLVGFATVSK